MNKNDFEVWIIHYLIQNHLQGKSNYDISIELRIPESKVKRLRYEATLKYGNPQDTDAYKVAFEHLLEKSLLKANGAVVQFAIEDMQLRKYLDSVLKKGGRFSDTSFNSEIVSIQADDLEFLIQSLWPDKDWEAVYKKAEKKFNTANITFKDLLKHLAQGAAQQAGKLFVNLSYAGIMTLL